QAVENDLYEADMVGATGTVGFGAKFLYAKKRWFFGANYYTSSTKHSYAEIDDEDFDDDWEELITGTRTLGSLIGGFQFKKGYLYLSYAALANLKFNENFVEDMDELNLTGSGFGFNATFFIYKRVTLGVEYFTLSYAAPDEDDGLSYEKFNESILLFNLGFSFGKKSSR
ncbi:hypothetical protein N9N67_08210, partial [Bacteriovoracaceae bacterium]|nr:hypothetical protein [Bacteriovoracaceae bacterium]